MSDTNGQQVDRLTKSLTLDYTPGYTGYGQMYLSKAPPFTLYQIQRMLQDARIVFGLWLIKGPILSRSKFFVDCDNTEAKDFLIKNISRFWRNGAMKALKAIEWGFSCSEPIYEVQDGKVLFKSLKDLHPLDCNPLTNEGKYVGATVKRVPTKGKVYLNGPQKGYPTKALWHVHNREVNPWRGRSRLYGGYLPWIELWAEGGYRDSRKLLFYKYAFGGNLVRYPGTGDSIQNTMSGSYPLVKSNKNIATEIGDKLRNGFSVAMPSLPDDRGNDAWRIDPVNIPVINPEFMSYGEVLRDEIWEGMGIPPEIARAEGTGAFAGRVIPMQAFFSILQEVVHWIISDADEQIFRPLVEMNFGCDTRYEIIPFSLLDSLEEKDNQAQQQPEAQDVGVPPNPGVQMANNTDDELSIYNIAIERKKRKIINQVKERNEIAC